MIIKRTKIWQTRPTRENAGLSKSLPFTRLTRVGKLFSPSIVTWVSRIVCLGIMYRWTLRKTLMCGNLVRGIL